MACHASAAACYARLQHSAGRGLKAASAVLCRLRDPESEDLRNKCPELTQEDAYLIPQAGYHRIERARLLMGEDAAPRCTVMRGNRGDGTYGTTSPFEAEPQYFYPGMEYAYMMVAPGPEDQVTNSLVDIGGRYGLLEAEETHVLQRQFFVAERDTEAQTCHMTFRGNPSLGGDIFILMRDVFVNGRAGDYVKLYAHHDGSAEVLLDTTDSIWGEMEEQTQVYDFQGSFGPNGMYGPVLLFEKREQQCEDYFNFLEESGLDHGSLPDETLDANGPMFAACHALFGGENGDGDDLYGTGQGAFRLPAEETTYFELVTHRGGDAYLGNGELLKSATATIGGVAGQQFPVPECAFDPKVEEVVYWGHNDEYLSLSCIESRHGPCDERAPDYVWKGVEYYSLGHSDDNRDKETCRFDYSSFEGRA